MNEYPIEMKDIVMEFNGVRALDGVNFKLKKGEINGLVGKNGAGKTTLMKIINGVYTQTSGTVKFWGKEIFRGTAVKEREKVVSMIYQDYSIVGEMPVYQNIFMNSEPVKRGFIDDKYCISSVKDFFASLGLDIDPMTKVKELSTGDMQLVEIAKAIMKDTNVILMDEPTAALDAQATEKFFEIIKKLKARGYSIVISTHHLRHIMELCDSVTVIRDGKMCMHKEIADTNMEEVISNMLGESGFSVKKRAVKKLDVSKPLFSMEKVTSKVLKKPLSLEVYPGEVVGLAGLKGAGRTEIFNCIYGLDPATGGQMHMDGKQIQSKSPTDAIRNGIFLVPENRHTQGLSLMHSLYDNALLSYLKQLVSRFFIDDKKGNEIVLRLINNMKVKTSGKDVRIANLSGGNQQKVVVGKALIVNPHLLLMDDPTYGVDIHAKKDISDSIEQYAAQGNGVLYVSSELSEMIENCDRIMIVKYNQIVGEIKDVPAANLTEDKLMAAIQ